MTQPYAFSKGCGLILQHQGTFHDKIYHFTLLAPRKQLPVHIRERKKDHLRKETKGSYSILCLTLSSFQGLVSSSEQLKYHL